MNYLSYLLCSVLLLFTFSKPCFCNTENQSSRINREPAVLGPPIVDESVLPLEESVSDQCVGDAWVEADQESCSEQLSPGSSHFCFDPTETADASGK